MEANLNYQKVYDDIVLRAKLRQISGVVERHHVIPRCFGGTDDPENIVRLTPEEHYVAHQLLCKLYPLNDDLAYAMLMMANGGSKTVRSNKAYGWVRKRVSKARTGKKRVLSDSARKKMSDSAKIGNSSRKGMTYKKREKRT